MIITEINTMNVMYLNHPETIQPPAPARSMEKLSSMKLVPGAKMLGTSSV